MNTNKNNQGDSRIRGSKNGCWRWSKLLRFRTNFHHNENSNHGSNGGKSAEQDKSDESRSSRDLVSHATDCSEKRNLMSLLNLNPSVEEDRKLLDSDAVIQEVERDPEAAAHTYAFKSHWYNTDTCYPLHQAIMLGASIDVVDILYKSYPPALEIKCCYPYELTALHLACTFSASPEVVSFLIEKQPTAVTEQSNNRYTPLDFACLWDSSLKVILQLLEEWPEATKVEYEHKPTPLQTAESRFASQDIQNVLFHVSMLCTKRVDKDISEEAVECFTRIGWCGGVMLALDRHPDVARALGIDIKAMPNFLSHVENCCKITTLWSVISNMQDLFVDI